MNSTFFKNENYINYQFYNYHPLKTAFIHVSNVCNFHCKVCSLPLKRKRLFVPLAELKQKLKKAKEFGLGNIICIGQEVILYPDIDEVIKWVFDRVGVNYITIVTNGLAFSETAIRKKLTSLKKYINKVYLGVSVNFYNAATFSDWSGHKQEIFKEWSLGFKWAVNEGFVSYIDTILKRDVSVPCILDFLSELTSGQSKKINLRIGELMPFGHLQRKFYDRLKLSLLETKKQIEKIAGLHPGKIEFESFPTCVFKQKDLKDEKYFIPNFNLAFENGIPIQYDPLIYETYYSGPTENWLISQQKLIDSYDKMFSYLNECGSCYYRGMCCGIPKAYLRIYGRNVTNEEIKVLKKVNWS